MSKKLTRSKLVKKLDSLFSQYIRKKNAVDEIASCFTCVMFLNTENSMYSEIN